MANAQKLGALLAITPLIASAIPAVADEYYETVEDISGKEYCIGKTTGTFTYRANGSGTQSEWSLTGEPWWLGYGIKNMGNDGKDSNVPYYLSKQVSDESLIFAYKTGSGENLRGWRNGENLGDSHFTNKNAETKFISIDECNPQADD